MPTLQQIAAELGFDIGSFGRRAFMSSFAAKVKYPLVIEQIEVNGYKGSGLSYSFENDDLPDDLKMGGTLQTRVKRYPNNTIPDTQVIRTEENEILIQGQFWSFDERGRSPIDKAELLEAIRLEGVPCRLSYMGGRIVRLGFVVEFTYTIHDETDIDWELRFEVYQHGDQVATSGPLGAPLHSVHGRVIDIVGRLNSNGEALEEMRSRMTTPDNSRALRDDVAGALGPIGEALTAMQQAKDGFQKNPDFAEMTVQQFKDFAGKVHTASTAVRRATSIVRDLPMNPVSAVEKALGWTGQYKRRKLLREASITFGRVREDLELMKKDADKLFNRREKIHIVTDRDSLRSISHKYYGTSDRWQEIAKANNITDPAAIQGKRLVIP